MDYSPRGLKDSEMTKATLMVVEFHEIRYEMNYHKSCKFIIDSRCFSHSVMSDSL